ncbi:MAG: hypothetical protein JRN57_02600 [Nitrososphaerota archaeon]|nr:hypothetical protein [Nitrososphaerota archaeon]
MGPRGKRGVSGYLEVFILIGVAVGGSGLVFGAAARYVGSGAGPSVSIVSATIRQGPYSAVESVTVSDTGTEPLGSLVITTSPAPPSAPYCYSVETPESGALISEACISQGDPGSVLVLAGARSGGSVLLELVITGAAFAVGSDHQVSVTAAGGAQASTDVQVVPT